MDPFHQSEMHALDDGEQIILHSLLLGAFNSVGMTPLRSASAQSKMECSFSKVA